MPGHTQLKGLLQDGEGMAKAIRRKGNSEMSAEKIKENLKGLFSSCAVLPLPALPGTDGCGIEPAPSREDLKTEDPMNRDGGGGQSRETQSGPESNF